MALFYLNFLIPARDGYELKGEPMTVSEFEKTFKQNKLAGKEAKLIIFADENNQLALSAVYIYRP